MLHHVVDMGESAEYFRVSMRNHDGADYKPQNEKGQWLQTIKMTQCLPPQKSI
jgi:hypothetical protein